jgi:hypothetical protein
MALMPMKLSHILSNMIDSYDICQLQSSKLTIFIIVVITQAYKYTDSLLLSIFGYPSLSSRPFSNSGDLSKVTVATLLEDAAKSFQSTKRRGSQVFHRRSICLYQDSSNCASFPKDVPNRAPPFEQQCLLEANPSR